MDFHSEPAAIAIGQKGNQSAGKKNKPLRTLMPVSPPAVTAATTFVPVPNTTQLQFSPLTGYWSCSSLLGEGLRTGMGRGSRNMCADLPFWQKAEPRISVLLVTVDGNIHTMCPSQFVMDLQGIASSPKNPRYCRQSYSWSVGGIAEFFFFLLPPRLPDLPARAWVLRCSRRAIEILQEEEINVNAWELILLVMWKGPIYLLRADFLVVVVMSEN